MTAALLYVLRNLGRRRTRTLVGTLGIFLTLALLTAIQIGLDSVSLSYLDLVSLQAGKADLLISGKDAQPLEPTPFDPASVQARVQGHPLLRGLSPRLAGVAQVRSGNAVHYAVLVGLDPARERELDLSGLVPEPRLADGSCALSRSLADKLAAQAGAFVSVQAGGFGPAVELRVEGRIDRQMMLPQPVRDYVVVSLAAARALLGEPERVHWLAGALRQPRAYYDARDLHHCVLRLKDAGEALAADLGVDYAVRLPKAEAITAFVNVTSPLRAAFGVFALLALAMTGLLVYSLISVAVEERIREHAILRTLGAKRRDVFGLVLTESVLLCFLGVVPGVFAGVGLARVMVNVVELALKARGDVITLEVSAATLWLTLAAGAVLSIGSALVPALRATRGRIVDALDPLRRGQIAAAPSREGQTHRPLVTIGLALSALSVVVFFVVPTAFLSGNPSLIGTVVLCLLLTIFLGFTLVMVGALPWVERVVLGALGWAIGPTAELVGRNLQRHRRRNTTTALLFTLSVALVIFLASLVALFSRTSLALVEHVHGADLRLRSDRLGGESVPADLERVEGVVRVSQAQHLRTRSRSGVAYDVVLSDLVGLKHLWIAPFGVDAALGEVLYPERIMVDSGPPDPLAELARWAKTRSGDGTTTNGLPPLILSQAAARFLEVDAGDLVQLSFRLGAESRDGRFRVAAVCSALPGFENFRARVAQAVGSGALLPIEEFQRMTQAAPPEAFQARYFVKTPGDDRTQKAVAGRIRESFDVRYRFSVQCTAEQKEEARVLYWATQVFFGLLLSVAVLIAVFSLIASMATSVLERRWEIGMLKALGLRRRQLFRMLLGEAVVLTFAAGLGGGAIGFTVAYLFVLQASVLMEMATVFTMPYLTFLATFVVGLGAAAIAAHLPTRRLLRQPAAEILRLER